ncbi:MAG: 3-hydroxyacyl-ACP dehydratase FabZ [Pseudomonadota bacterium]
MTAESLDIRAIIAKIPHRYPFLLIDRVLSVTPNESATALKNVTINEPFFEGHFPGRPVMPGVLIVEAMAQTSAVLSAVTLGELEPGSFYFFTGIDKTRFRQPVVPGDQLQLHISINRRIKSMWRFSGEAYVDDKKVASAELMCALGK